MTILCFDCGLANDLRLMGHSVCDVQTAESIVDVPELIRQMGIVPDLVVQQERLAPRLLLRGLDRVDCPTVFLAVDSHLNMLWHQPYSRLFDALLTPHFSLFRNHRATRHPRILHFPHWGTEVAWVPHRQRRHHLAVCARVDKYRKIRHRLFTTLRVTHALRLREGLSHEEMLGMYAQSRAVPNETVGFEVNFRLFEAASCGCAVFTPHIGDDQDSVFEPDSEVFLYREVCELLDKLTWAENNPEALEAAGFAARERVRREHLSRHRARTLLALAATLTRERVRGEVASRLFWLSTVHCARSGWHPAGVAELLSEAESLSPHPSVAAAVLQLLGDSGRGALILNLCRDILAVNAFPDSLELNSIASASAMLQGDHHLARKFLLRYLVETRQSLEIPEAPVPAAICQAWAELLRRNGVLAYPGFLYDAPSRQIPRSSLDFLELASSLSPDDLSITRKMERLCRLVPAYTHRRTNLLAEICRAVPQSWRLAFHQGVAALKACDREGGLLALNRARKTALVSGDANLFMRSLAAVDAEGYILKELDSLAL